MTQTTFAFVVDKPGDALDGAHIVIFAADATEADRLAAVRSRLWRAPLRRAVPCTAASLARGAA